MPKFEVLWSANVVLSSIVEAETAQEAERMCMNNDVSVKQAYMKECEPTYAKAVFDEEDDKI